MFEKFPQIAGYAPAELEEIGLFRVTPEIISVLDYRKGFGHADLVKLAASVLAPEVRGIKHLAVPAKAGTRPSHGYRLSPVMRGKRGALQIG